MGYVLFVDGDWDKLMMACEELGYDKSSILKNALHEFFRRHRDYYVKAGVTDAAARGIGSSEHFTILRDKSDEDLPPYGEIYPDFGPSPIDSILPVPSEPRFRRAYNILRLSRYNFVLLRVARIVHRDSYPQLVGRLVRSHLADHWEQTYLPQIAHDELSDYQ